MLLASANERTPVERQVEAVKVLASIAPDVTETIGYEELSNSDKFEHADCAGKSAAAVLAYLACRLIWSRIGVDLSATLGTTPIEVDTTERDPASWWTQMAWFL